MKLTKFINNDNKNILDEIVSYCKNYFHPVGNIIFTADANFNPNNSFQGNWQIIRDCFIMQKSSSLASSNIKINGNYYNGGEYSEKNETTQAQEDNQEYYPRVSIMTKNLTAGNLPVHKHYYTPNITISCSKERTKHNSYIATTSSDKWIYQYRYAKTNSESSEGISKAVSVLPFSTETATFKHKHYYSCSRYSDNFSNVTYSMGNYTIVSTNTGSNSSFTIIPKYKAYYCWERIS